MNENRNPKKKKRGFVPNPKQEARCPFATSQRIHRRVRLARPEKGAAVPKFGDWDESNPASADGYTHIFNKVREEKQSGANILSMPTDTPFSNGQRRGNVNNKSTILINVLVYYPYVIHHSRKRPAFDMSRSVGALAENDLFVYNLSDSIDNGKLYETFARFGNFSSCTVAATSDGKSKGYGFI
ncbi:hypothetical protein GIB67_034913 [Kingdonia uniflora]|uniref:RRM domain-containing protein n=1 Tax=Kingdonia uniflora TaxID=39325 RepID=A0A7J7NHC0_9MAGN|nr:hypothetical protein GIB67_034913 [Kingdonia uniflora]